MPEHDTARYQSTAADFDFLDGTFEIANRRLEERLGGCREWIEFPARRLVPQWLVGRGSSLPVAVAVQDEPIA